MTFDYDAPDVPASVIADIAAEIKNDGKPVPLTDEQKFARQIEREIWAEEQAWKSEQRKIERERQEAAKVEADGAEAAAEIAEANRKARLERQERDRERQRERQINELHYRARQAELWQSNVDAAARTAVQQRYRQTLMGELDAMINPPQPQPESNNVTEIVYTSEDEAGSPHLGDRDFNPNLWKKI